MNSSVFNHLKFGKAENLLLQILNSVSKNRFYDPYSNQNPIGSAPAVRARLRDWGLVRVIIIRLS